MALVRVYVEMGRETRERIEHVPDVLWLVMSPLERNEYCAGMAVDFQNEVAPCGHEVVEEPDLD